jgi:hypothetical protein
VDDGASIDKALDTVLTDSLRYVGEHYDAAKDWDAFLNEMFDHVLGTAEQWNRFDALADAGDAAEMKRFFDELGPERFDRLLGATGALAAIRVKAFSVGAEWEHQARLFGEEVAAAGFPERGTPERTALFALGITDGEYDPTPRDVVVNYLLNVPGGPDDAIVDFMADEDEDPFAEMLKSREQHRHELEQAIEEEERRVRDEEDDD